MDSHLPTNPRLLTPLYRSKLHDIAITLHLIFNTSSVLYMFFGGYALSALGNFRVTKDIQCFASLSKQEIQDLLLSRKEFVAVKDTRNDVAVFTWSDNAGRGSSVRVEIYCADCEGCDYSLYDTFCSSVSVEGHTLEPTKVTIMHPVALFKGKLHAAALRPYFVWYDAVDIRFLDNLFPLLLQENRLGFNHWHIGRAIRRHPELGFIFNKIGCDVEEAMSFAGDPVTCEEWDVQFALLQ